jgi:hypothetical protein
MARYILFVLSGPTAGPGDEDEYNKWYDEIHLPDLKAIEGVKTARRYKVVQGARGLDAWPYAAAYELETDDLQKVFDAMENNMRPFSPTYDRSKSANVVAMQISGDE